MTDSDRDNLKKLRIVLAGEAARLNADFSSLVASLREPTTELKLARAELDAINTLLTIIDLRQMETPTPVVTPERKPSATSQGNKPIFAMELASGLVVEFPSIAEAARVTKGSVSLVTKAAILTGKAEWNLGVEHLAKTPYRHTKGWAYCFKETLDDEE